MGWGDGSDSILERPGGADEVGEVLTRFAKKGGKLASLKFRRSLNTDVFWETLACFGIWEAWQRSLSMGSVIPCGRHGSARPGVGGSGG
jgi:hypothetical protein